VMMNHIYYALQYWTIRSNV